MGADTDTRTGRLRAALRGPGTVVAPFAFDALQARLAEREGFEAVYMTGFGTAAARGHPDLGLLTMSEMVDNVRAMAGAIGVPLICDADTGYGNPLNVARTVHEYERAGAAALHLEDQVWPKRCGFLDGKQVIGLDEVLPKLRAALDARDDPDLVVIARTDALQPHGWDEAERRARAFAEAGADLVFVDGIRTRDDLDRYAERLGDLPLVYNGALPVAEAESRGFRLMLCISTLLAQFANTRDALRELKRTGRVAAGGADQFEDFVDLLGVEEALAKAGKYA